MREMLDRQLANLNLQISSLGRLAIQQVENSIQVIERRDAVLAGAVAEADGALDEAESAIDGQVIRVIALQQPEATDLRSLLAALRIGVALERIGDHAKTIVKRVPALCDRLALPIDPDFLDIARLALNEVTEVMRAYETGDADLALAVRARDVTLDRLYVSYSEKLLRAMEADPAMVRPGTFLLYAARNYERIGDQATNIAERVHFALRGQLPAEERRRQTAAVC
jgi:phosphate transport system protein